MREANMSIFQIWHFDKEEKKETFCIWVDSELGKWTAQTELLLWQTYKTVVLASMMGTNFILRNMHLTWVSKQTQR